MPAIRLSYAAPLSTAYDWTVVHDDAQGSVLGVTSSAGAKVERTICMPYGNWDDVLFAWRSAGLTDPANPTERSAASTPTSHSYIGERLDAEAGLQYLNARHCDPKLGPPRENSLSDCFLILVDHPVRPAVGEPAPALGSTAIPIRAGTR